jgi:hypothetical protein
MSSLQKELLEAAESGNTREVLKLLELGADIEADRSTPDPYEDIDSLSLAALNGHMETVSALLERGAKKINQALLNASKGGNCQIIELLLNKGANLEHDNEMAACHAAQEGHLEALELLLDKGCDAKKEFLLDSAAMSGDEKLFDYVLTRGQFMQRDLNEVLPALAILGDTKRMKALIEAGADINHKEEHVYMEIDFYPKAIAKAGLHGKPESIRCLLSYYSDEELKKLERIGKGSTNPKKTIEKLITEEKNKRTIKKTLGEIKEETLEI